jgi:secretory lipase
MNDVIVTTRRSIGAVLTAVLLLLLGLIPAQGAAVNRQPVQAGSLLASASLPAALRLNDAARAAKVWYRSTDWAGRPTVVSGTVTVPAGLPPAGGWPVVSFGHGLSGIADACAPSRTGPSPWERAVQEALLDAGYIVAVSDFQGIGTPGPASIGHGIATAEALIDIVRATGQLARISRDWVAVGYSLGGQGALFTGSVAPGYAPELRERGIVGMAAVSQWALLTEGGSAPSLPVAPSGPFALSSLERSFAEGFRARDWTTPAGQALVEKARHICIDEMVTELAGITNAEFYTDPAAAAAEQIRLMADQEIPVADYAIPVRLVHGTADQLPAIISEITAGQLAAAGTDAQFIPVDGADHLTLQPQIAAQVVNWVNEFTAAG